MYGLIKTNLWCKRKQQCTWIIMCGCQLDIFVIVFGNNFVFFCKSVWQFTDAFGVFPFSPASRKCEQLRAAGCVLICSLMFRSPGEFAWSPHHHSSVFFSSVLTGVLVHSVRLPVPCKNFLPSLFVLRPCSIVSLTEIGPQPGVLPHRLCRSPGHRALQDPPRCPTGPCAILYVTSGLRGREWVVVPSHLTWNLIRESVNDLPFRGRAKIYSYTHHIDSCFFLSGPRARFFLGRRGERGDWGRWGTPASLWCSRRGGIIWGSS